MEGEHTMEDAVKGEQATQDALKEEQAEQDAIKLERDALQAELEALKAQRLAFAAEIAEMRRERAELEAEKEKIRIEKEALQAAREAVRIMSNAGSVKSTYRNTSRKRKKGEKLEKDSFSCVTNGVSDQETNGGKRPPPSPGPKLRHARKRTHSSDVADETRGWKSSSKTRLKRSRLDSQDTSNSAATKAVTKMQQQRVEASLDEEEEDHKFSPKMQQRKSQRVSTFLSEEEKGGRTRESGLKTGQNHNTKTVKMNFSDSDGDDEDMMYTAASADEELENLAVSFDQPATDSAHISSPPHSPAVQDGDSGDASAATTAVVEGKAVQDQTACTSLKSPRSKQSRAMTSHVCKDCGRSFRWTSHYLNHLKTHSGERSHQCSECQETFIRANHLAVHMRKHTTARQQHACSHCALMFSSKTGLRKHIHNSHNKPAKAKKEFKCTECQEVFTKASSLAVHMGVHSDGKPFKCTDCKASFTSQGNLTVHIKKHRGEKPFRCTECEATFPRSADLRSHARKHSTVKPYVCKICCAAFCRAGDLKPHMRTHTGEKPFQCEVCGAAFSTSSNLAVHRRTHTGERPFQCDKCGASFSQLGHLTRHSMQHSTEHAYRCTSCQATFGNAYHLKVHMQRHNTDNTFKCKCGAAFSRASILTEHMRIHTGEKPYKCNQCSAAFARSANLAAHRRKHTGERPYVCPHCQQGFTQSTSLNRHLQSKNACLTRRGLASSKSQTPAAGGEGEGKASMSMGGVAGEEPSSAAVGQEGSKPLSSGMGGDGVGDFYSDDLTGMKLQTESSLLTNGQGINRNHFLSPSSVADAAVAGSAPASSQPHCFDNRNGMAVVRGANKTADIKELQIVNIFSLRSSSQEENVPRTSMDPTQQFCFPVNGEDATLEQPGANHVTKDGIFSEGNLPTSTSVLLQSSSAPTGMDRAVSSAALHMVGSLSDAGNSMMPLPPVTVVTGYQGVSSPAGSLMAMRNLGHPANFFHPHLSPPHLPHSHGQMHHQ